MAIDMALDDVIRQNRSVSRRRSVGGGGFRRAAEDDAIRSRTSAPPRRRDVETRRRQPQQQVFTIRNDRFSDEATISVANLFHEVTREDLQELFSRVGPVKSVRIHYDRAGRSNGTANVTFFSRRDAMVAADRFHHVPLDGYPMQIDLLASPSRSSADHPPPPRHDDWRGTTRGVRKHVDAPHPLRSQHYGRRRPEASSRGPPRSSRGRPPVDAHALDTELDNYMMQQ